MKKRYSRRERGMDGKGRRRERRLKFSEAGDDFSSCLSGGKAARLGEVSSVTSRSRAGNRFPGGVGRQAGRQSVNASGGREKEMGQEMESITE